MRVSRVKWLPASMAAGALVITAFSTAVPAHAASGTLVMKSNGGGQSGSAVATFDTPVKGQQVALEALTIVTKVTTEVKTATWTKIATAKEDSSGKATFSINPLEVKHTYRARTGSANAGTEIISSTVDFAASPTTKNDGLATVYFNANEGHSVDTRTRYFEGQFSMTTGYSPYGSCSAVSATDDKAGNHATMKGRGNYSWSFPKKSFTLKLDNKIDLCGMGKSKKWALLGTQYDKSQLRTQAAFYFGSKLTNLGWTPKVTPVDLYVNGSYRGIYQLVERITIDSKRVNANGAEAAGSLDTGYLLEWDYRADRGDSSAPDHLIDTGTRGIIGIKEPEDGDDVPISSAQLKYVRDYVNKADDVLFSSDYGDNTNGWQKYIDKDSAVDFYIAQEVMKPVDGNMWASVYMYKKAGGKIFFGPMWDYDLAEGSADRAGGTASSKGFYIRTSGCFGQATCKDAAKQSSTDWFNRLNQDSEFRAAVKVRYNSLYSQLATTDNYVNDQRTHINKAIGYNFEKWSISEHLSTRQVVKGSYSKEVSYLTGWLNSRIGWLHDNF